MGETLICNVYEQEKDDLLGILPNLRNMLPVDLPTVVDTTICSSYSHHADGDLCLLRRVACWIHHGTD
jgi:hypothetical protein